MNELPLFSGRTYDDKRDGPRLAAQLHAVKALMLDGAWHTLAEISASTGHPQASVSARLRDLRRSENGGWDVQRRYVERGLWKYRLAHF